MVQTSSVTHYPTQKRSRSQKTKKWAQDCVDSADTVGLYQNEGVRQYRKNKFINYNLYNGIVDRSDMELIVNPNNIIANYIPDKIPHYAVAAPKIDLLVGEELKRRFDYKVVVTNPEAISSKEEEMAEMWKAQLMIVVEDPNLTQDQVEAKMRKFEKYLKYEWQDIRELTSTNILRHYSEEQNFKLIFSGGFKDLTLNAEEIFQCDIISKEPVLHKLNPLKVFTLRSGSSNWIQDSDLIIIEEYWNPGRIIDTYHDVLKDKDVKTLEEGFTNSGDGKHTGAFNQEPNFFVDASELDMYTGLASQHGYEFGNFTDNNGNIRVLRVFWKSFRKVKLVTFFDEDGNEQKEYYPEDYEPDESLGETCITQWLNEWWEGTKIGSDIYVRMRPRPIQYNKIDNPSKCHPGIIGYIHSTNQFRAVSLMDRMKQYQYLYDAVKHRLNQAISKNLGPLLELDLAKVPEDWEVEKWLYFAVTNGIAVVDSFKEGNKGAATGKLAGGMNTTGRVFNLDMGNYIQQHINMLEWVKMEMGEIVGISKQREGQISNRETVGGVERSVNQSSHITEELFFIHDSVKVEVLKCFLETAKIALKNNNKKIQYILGDESIKILNTDIEGWSDADYGILVNVNNKYQELDQVMKELAHAGIQNDKINYSTLMSIYLSDSLSDMRRKIEISEEEKEQSEQQRFQAEQESIQAQIQQRTQSEEAGRMLDKEKNIRDNLTKVEIKLMEIQQSVSQGEMVEDDGLELTKHKDTLMFQMKQLDQDMKKHKDLMGLKDKELDIKRQDLVVKRNKKTV